MSFEHKFIHGIDQHQRQVFDDIDLPPMEDEEEESMVPDFSGRELIRDQNNETVVSGLTAITGVTGVTGFTGTTGLGGGPAGGVGGVGGDRSIVVSNRFGPLGGVGQMMDTLEEGDEDEDSPEDTRSRSNRSVKSRSSWASRGTRSVQSRQSRGSNASKKSRGPSSSLRNSGMGSSVRSGMGGSVRSGLGGSIRSGLSGSVRSGMGEGSVSGGASVASRSLAGSLRKSGFASSGASVASKGSTVSFRSSLGGSLHGSITGQNAVASSGVRSASSSKRRSTPEAAAPEQPAPPTSSFTSGQSKSILRNSSLHSSFNTISTSQTTSANQTSNNTIPIEDMNNARLFDQHPNGATREVDVTNFDLSIEADELDSLPEEYKADADNNLGILNQRNAAVNENDPSTHAEDGPSSDYVAYDILPSSETYKDVGSPFSKKRRWHTLMTLVAALALAIVGLYISIDILSSSSDALTKEQQQHHYSGYNGLRPSSTSLPASSSGYFFVPGFKFGGGSGGLIGGQEKERRIQLAYSQYGSNLGGAAQFQRAGHGSSPYYAGSGSRGGGAISSFNVARSGSSRASYQTSSGNSRSSYQTSGAYASSGLLGFLSRSKDSSSLESEKPPDPFHGLGPPQFNPEYANLPDNGHLKSTLTAVPLTSYTPPNSQGSNSYTPMVIDPMIHGSLMDLSILPFNPIREIPVIWDVPQSGGSGIESIFGSCLRLVQCSEVGGEILFREYQEPQDESEQTLGDESLLRRTGGRNLMQLVAKDDTSGAGPQKMHLVSKQEASMNNDVDVNLIGESYAVFDPPLKTEFSYTSMYVNVDCTTPEGVDRGVSHRLATSDMVDVIYSPDIMDVSRLFAPPIEAYGRAVVILRHPMERTVAKYEYLRTAHHDPNSRTVSNMSLEEFVRSDFANDNFLTRTLSANMDSPLQQNDLDMAKEILQRKFIVGLFDHMEDSLERFETFFGWHVNDDARACQENEVHREMAKHYNNIMMHGDLDGDEGMHSGLTAEALSILAEKNRWDLQVFDFAKFLYEYQGRVLFGY